MDWNVNTTFIVCKVFFFEKDTFLVLQTKRSKNKKKANSKNISTVKFEIKSGT